MSECDTNEADLKRKEEAQKLFKDFKTETEKRQVSSSENFDKSVLTYSSWALGISVAFLKDFVPIMIATFPTLLYLSWVMFGLAIGLTTSSFLISYRGLEISLLHAEKYYLEEDEAFFNKKNIYNEAVKWFNRVSAVAFLAGLILTLLFVSFNLEKSSIMKTKSSSGIALEALCSPRMTKVQQGASALTKGLPAASMQKLPNSGASTSNSQATAGNQSAPQVKPTK